MMSDSPPFLLQLATAPYVLNAIQWDNFTSEFYGKVREGAAMTGDLGGSSPGDDEVTIEFEKETEMHEFLKAVRCFAKVH